MKSGKRIGSVALAFALAVSALTATTANAQSTPETVTFAKHIAPILQRSCQNCHRPDGVAPMSLVTYEDVRPWARSIKTRTSIGPKAGVMPPWYIEKNIGIQAYKNDPSLSPSEIRSLPNGPTAVRRAATTPTCRSPASSRTRTCGRSARPTSSSR